MKTLIVLMLLVLFSGLAINNLVSQKPVKEIHEEVDLTLPFACTNQDLVGKVTFEVAFLNNKVQHRFYGPLIGQSDGQEYYIDGIQNISESNWDDWGTKALPWT